MMMAGSKIRARVGRGGALTRVSTVSMASAFCVSRGGGNSAPSLIINWSGSSWLTSIGSMDIVPSLALVLALVAAKLARRELLEVLLLLLLTMAIVFEVDGEWVMTGVVSGRYLTWHDPECESLGVSEDAGI